jgi:hypothetical protein
VAEPIPSQNAADPAVSRPLLWAELTLKGLILLASFWLLGLSLYTTNNDLQLPLVQHAADPRLFPGDAFVSTLSHYASVLWQVLWVPFRLLPERPLLFVLTFIQRLFWLYAAGRLSRALTARNRIAELVTWCFCCFGLDPFVGWGTGLPSYFEHTSVGIATFLLSLALWIERKPLRAGAWLGVMGLCNIMHAVFAVVLLAGGLMLAPRLRANKRSLLYPTGVAVIIMSPALWMASSAAATPPIDSESFVQLLWFYCSGHFFPSCWLVSEWITLLLAGAATFAVLVVWKGDRSSKGLILGISAASLAFLCASRGAEAMGSPALLILQLARAMDLWTCVAAVVVSALLADLMTSTHRRWVVFVGCVGLLACVFLWKLHTWLWRPFDLVFVALVASATAILARRQGRWTWTAAPLLPMFAVMLLFGWSIAATKHPPGMARFEPRLRAEIAVASWAKTETPRDAVFLVDPDWGGFRSMSHRSSFLTWKEGAAILWYPQFARTWVQRIGALGVDPFAAGARYPASRALLSRAFAGLDDARALWLARRFGLGYWLVPAKRSSNLTVAYANESFKVLRLESTPD